MKDPNNPTVIIKCAPGCSTCTSTIDNCSACEDSPTQYFLTADGHCVLECPSGSQINTVTNKCEPCDFNNE